MDWVKTEFLIGRYPARFNEKTGLPSFLEAIKKEGIRRVIDVRADPRLPFHFQPARMLELLAPEGIEYVRYHELGNPRTLRDQARFKTDHPDVEMAKRLYVLHIAGSRQDALDKLYGLLQDHVTTALVCTCRSDSICHRFWLKEILDR